MLLFSSSCFVPVFSLVWECVAGVCLTFFFFWSLASLVLLLTLLVSRHCSLTSALFCISYDFGSNFLKLWERCCRKKKIKQKQSMWSLYWCQSEINKNTSKDCGGSVLFSLGRGHLTVLTENNKYFPACLQCGSTGDYKIPPDEISKIRFALSLLSVAVWVERGLLFLILDLANILKPLSVNSHMQTWLLV